MTKLVSLLFVASIGCVVQPPPPVAPAPAPGAVPAEGEPAPAEGEPGEAPPAEAPQVGPRGDLNDYDGPITCTTTEDITIESVDVDLGGDSIQVFGSCSIYITNSRIASTRAALVITGSGDIHVQDSEIVGMPAAQVMGSGNINFSRSYVRGDLAVTGSGDVNLTGNVVEGRSSVLGTGRVNDGGGNQFR